MNKDKKSPSLEACLGKRLLFTTRLVTAPHEGYLCEISPSKKYACMLCVNTAGQVYEDWVEKDSLKVVEILPLTSRSRKRFGVKERAKGKGAKWGGVDV